MFRCFAFRECRDFFLQCLKKHFPGFCDNILMGCICLMSVAAYSSTFSPSVGGGAVGGGGGEREREREREVGVRVG